ncbi:prephenate dehydrogenase [Corynebacterium heidelbergense]|uniref:Prephenate dehydrogenase n=1 Tax=Corynebacterium heidelbergense TaxID=2055947 RepID=A0A364V833_9CORY|nr:prephenate dehydrogenase [Corynebacterium heidelbergense]
MGSVNAISKPTPVNPRLSSLPGESFPVCIIGLGLIGGSLMRDLAAAGWPVFGWNRSAHTVKVANRSGFDVSGDLDATLRRAEAEKALVVLGVPMPALPRMLEAIAQHAPSVGFTDVTSVKAEVHELVEQHGLTDRFVGGHPMAGTANSGWDATMSGLFDGAVWVITYDNAKNRGQRGARLWLDTWRRTVQMAEAVGAAVVPTVARRHDSAVARISHLPHVLAEALAVTGDMGGPLSLTLAATSFRDGTRVAGTEPELVRAMCENNREALVKALDEALALLQKAREDIASPGQDLHRLATEGHAARMRFEARAGRKVKDAPRRPIIRVQPGAPGWTDQLSSAESMGAQIGIF